MTVPLSLRLPVSALAVAVHGVSRLEVPLRRKFGFTVPVSRRGGVVVYTRQIWPPRAITSNYRDTANLGLGDPPRVTLYCHPPTRVVVMVDRLTIAVNSQPQPTPLVDACDWAQ